MSQGGESHGYEGNDLSSPAMVIRGRLMAKPRDGVEWRPAILRS